jgi:hypothetical protein
MVAVDLVAAVAVAVVAAVRPQPLLEAAAPEHRAVHPRRSRTSPRSFLELRMR